MQRLAACLQCVCLAALAVAATFGCESSPPPVSPAVNNTRAAGAQPVQPPPPVMIHPGDRLSLRTRTAGGPDEATFIAFVAPDGTVTFDSVGTFDTRQRTIRAIEQDVLDRINDHGRLVATARVARAPIASVGLFLAPDPATFHRLMMDGDAVLRIDAQCDPNWQWVQVTDLAHARLLPTTLRRGGRWTLAGPAHAKLVGDELVAGIASLDDTRSAAGILMRWALKPATALSLEHVTSTQRGQLLLVVLDDQLIAAPRITATASVLRLPPLPVTTANRLRAVLEPPAPGNPEAPGTPGVPAAVDQLSNGPTTTRPPL